MPSATPALEATDLRKTYRTGMLRRSDRHALNGVTFRVDRGEIFGLLGQNGAGKTTFVKIALGIVRKSAGQARLLGMPAGDRGARFSVGYLPEHLRLPRHLTALTALEYLGGLSGVSPGQVRKKAPELLEMVGIASRARDGVGTYSKGMLQRLGLAQALLHDPELVVLDEPTDGLDPVARSQVRGFLLELKRRGKTVFLNSHLLQEVELVCDRVAILHAGELRRCGTIAEVTAAASHEGIAFSLEISADETMLAQTFAGDQSWRATSDGTFLHEASAQEQSEIDRLIDRCRTAGFGIISLKRRRSTLEDAFLRIIDAEPVGKTS